jgi:hypothetical protein
MIGRRNQRQADSTLALLGQVLADYGKWRHKLAEWATVGFQSGGGVAVSGSCSSSITERAALKPDLMRDALAETDRKFADLSELAEWFAKRRAWVLASPKPPEEWAVHCENPKCRERLKENERPRNGECPRCARHRARYGLAWPLKHVDGRQVRPARVRPEHGA